MAVERTRLVAENEGFVAFVPYFARYPYEVHVVSRRHRPSLSDLSTAEGRDLAPVLATLTFQTRLLV